MKKLIALFAGIAMVAGFAMTAAAADWNFYGSARISTFIVDTDFEDFVNGIGDNDDTDLGHELQGNSRIGARVKVSDELSGRFEFGVNNSTVTSRLIYGTWNFGAGALTVGKFYSPLNLFYSNQVFGSDSNMLNIGGMYSGRNAGIQLKFGNFKIAALQPNSSTNTFFLGTDISAVTPVDIDTTFPKIEASYHLDLGTGFIDIAGGYNTYDLDLGFADDDIDSWIIALGGGMNFGNFYVKGDIWFGENVGAYGIWHNTVDDPLSIPGVISDDAESMGFLIVVGAKINDMISVEAGYGYTETDTDNSALGFDLEDDYSAWYIQATINLAPGVFIVPEIGYLDGEETDVQVADFDDPTTLYYGLKWQINF